MKNFLTQVKLNVLRLALRNKRFLFFSFAFPILFYLLYTKLMNVGIPAPAMKTWQLQFMVSMAVYSSLISCVSSAPSLLTEDRERHFTLFVQLTGASKLRYYASMVAVFLPLSLVALAALGLVATLVNGVSLSLLYWLILVVLLPLLSIPLLLIGILISLVGSSALVNLLGQIVMFGFAILGGLWWPIDMLPAWLQHIGKMLPSYQIATLMQQIVQKTSISTENIIGLIIWLIFLLAALILVNRRLRLREVQTI